MSHIGLNPETQTQMLKGDIEVELVAATLESTLVLMYEARASAFRHCLECAPANDAGDGGVQILLPDGIGE